MTRVTRQQMTVFIHDQSFACYNLGIQHALEVVAHQRALNPTDADGALDAVAMDLRVLLKNTLVEADAENTP